jgi:hypothetical protein
MMPNEEDMASDFDFWRALNNNYYYFIFNGEICSLERLDKTGITTPQAIVCKNAKLYEVDYALIDAGCFLFPDLSNIDSQSSRQS